MSNSPTPPGSDWIAIIRRPTLDEFSAAFADAVVLEGSVVKQAVVGAAAILRFFDATRVMYDSIAFVHESNADSRTFLEWEGVYQGAPVAGTTVLTRDGRGKIVSIRLFHRPYAQVLAFSAGLDALLKD
ncbi:hypothetical protein [Rugamonas sp.]|uniref:hypothetical protein n=1 Tax=Rugamonas sp. TaxID=1926287 RepID=UPI0025D44925|nr:hypothetical protein [Rugamonas sp.]